MEIDLRRKMVELVVSIGFILLQDVPEREDNHVEGLADQRNSSVECRRSGRPRCAGECDC